MEKGVGQPITWKIGHCTTPALSNFDKLCETAYLNAKNSFRYEWEIHFLTGKKYFSTEIKNSDRLKKIITRIKIVYDIIKNCKWKKYVVRTYMTNSAMDRSWI